MEDPETLRLVIKHYQYLLTQYNAPGARGRLRDLLSEAQARLPDAVADASNAKRRQASG